MLSSPQQATKQTSNELSSQLATRTSGYRLDRSGQDLIHRIVGSALPCHALLSLGFAAHRDFVPQALTIQFFLLLGFFRKFFFDLGSLGGFSCRIGLLR
jgi:hypothetical protein